jgi:shikimate kinase
MSDKVILIGPPGAGKSTIGQSLAKKMRVKFADTDALIEAKLEVPPKVAAPTLLTFPLPNIKSVEPLV